MGNFVSYSNADSLMTAIGQKFAAMSGAYIFKGSVTFANLPSTLTEAMTGYVYNMSEEFTTDARFVEGAGKKYPAGTNVAVANVSSTSTADMKFDVIGSFVDVDGIYAAIDDVAALIAPDFDETVPYIAGDFVNYNGDLYEFAEAHAAGAWIGTDAISTTVGSRLKYIQNSISAIYGVIGTIVGDLADEFSTATAYTTGDAVIYENALYKFTADKAAGAWDSTKVTATTVEDLINAAEPAELTTEQVNALIALL